MVEFLLALVVAAASAFVVRLLGMRSFERMIDAFAQLVGGSAVLGLGYSNGANILASTLFAAPDLFDAAALMHPLIPFRPEDNPALAGRKIGSL